MVSACSYVQNLYGSILIRKWIWYNMLLMISLVAIESRFYFFLDINLFCWLLFQRELIYLLQYLSKP